MSRRFSRSRAGKLPFEVAKARAVQRLFAEKVIEKDFVDLNKVRYVCGIDVAYFREGTKEWGVAAACVLNYPSLEVLEVKCSVLEIKVPYVPTLLAFRELLPMHRAYLLLSFEPDVVFINGQGRIHPYLCGIACHLGVLIDKPTIGVAKKLLCGEIAEDSEKIYAPVVFKGKVVGAYIKSKRIFVSIGHKISLDTACRLALMCSTKRYRLPVPLQRAHEEATRYAKSFKTKPLF
ncbi:MAG: endonuclease V [Thermoprotei archaeon]|nr:MAG: endonuclease V [Thermoprotei archaeon]